VALRVFSVDLSTAMKMRAADDELRPCSSPTMPAEGFDKLSDQMLLEILSYVPHDDYLNIRLVNRRFNRISTDRSLWKKVSFSFIYDELTPGRLDYSVAMRSS
jgi:hypothetical protein